MLNPLEQKLLRNVDELWDSDLKIVFDMSVQLMYWNNSKYRKAIDDKRMVFVTNITKLYSSEAYIVPCETVEISLKATYDRKTVDGMYMLNEKVFSDNIELYCGTFSAYVDKFQHLMDLSLEAGLHKAWKLYHEISISNLVVTKEMRDERSKIPVENEILNFFSIIPMFLILLVGHSLALLSFLFEIFHSDFISRITMDVIKSHLQCFNFKRKYARRVHRT